MANVERGYSFVGTTEQMELGLSVLDGLLNCQAPQVNPRVKRSSFMSGITLNQAIKLALLFHLP